MATPSHDSGFLPLATAALRRYGMMVGMFAVPFSSLRVLVMRLCGVRVGRGCYVGFNVAFDTNFPALIRIGDAVTISRRSRSVTAPSRSPRRSGSSAGASGSRRSSTATARGAGTSAPETS